MRNPTRVMTSPSPPESAAADLIAARLAPAGSAEWAVVSGSGLGVLATLGREVAALPYSEIPGLGGSGVAGHASRWILAEAAGRRFYCLLGRRHLYEGIDTAAAGFAMRILARLGVKNVILTNAAGGLGSLLRPGELMLIRDHLNLMFRRSVGSLAGIFPSAPETIYDVPLCGYLLQCALEAQITLREGVYAAVSGPCYETRAEAALLGRLGAAAAGMSTVPEALAARAAGMRVAAISLITNSHWHRSGPASHEEVLQAAARSGQALLTVLGRALEIADCGLRIKIQYKIS